MDLTTLAESAGALPALEQAFQTALPRKWAEAYLQTEAGQPFTFTDRPWLRQLWDDLARNIVIRKSAQVGLTTWAYARAMHGACVRGETAIYTMPTDGDIDDFVVGRVNKVIAASAYLRRAVGRERGAGPARRNVDNIGLKQFYQGTIYFRGTFSRSGALSVPAHALYHDEVDASNQEVLEAYEHRLDALEPDQKQRYYFSHPSVDAFGIDALYQASDQRQWQVRCGCGWDGPLDYWEHTDGHGAVLRCTRCGGALDPRQGRWVAAFPDRPMHGYHVSRLLLCVPDRPERLQALHDAREKAKHLYLFKNMDLGEPSSEGAMRITRDQILAAAFVEPYPRQEAAVFNSGPYFGGVDQGDTLTVWIVRADPALDGRALRTVYFARLRDPGRGMGAWQDVAALLTRFRITLMVVDANPNSAPAHQLARDFPGRVLLCYYSESQRAEATVAAEARAALTAGTAGQDPTTRWEITVNRTETLDNAASDLIGGRVLLPGSPTDPEAEELYRHIGHNVRKPEQTPAGTTIYRWVKTGINDYFHALNYVRIAAEAGAHLADLTYSLPAPVLVRGVPRRLA